MPGPGVVLRTVSTNRDLRAFLRLPWTIYRDDPLWVPPLLSEVRRVLDRSRHPFHQHAEVEYFLAVRGDQVVGRVAASVNHRLNDFHRSKVGEFGFFECLDDSEGARTLLDASRRWCQERGMAVLRGPMSFSTNEEFCSPGVLVEGFQHPPVMMMAHTPAYYARLLEACGFRKAKDLVCYRMDRPDPPERLVRGAARVLSREKLVIRPLDMGDFQAEVGRIKGIYNSAWERNWGFVPMTEAEMDLMARSLRPVVDPRFCVLAEVEGMPAGFALQLPDLNRAFRHMGGRWLPLGWLKYLWHRRAIDSARVLTLGIRPEYRHKGLDALLILHLFRESRRAGFTSAECSWILEDNLVTRNAIERVGGYVYKVYRVYEKPVAPPSANHVATDP
jgi:GNAT superfamily N-acetyltransferase